MYDKPPFEVTNEMLNLCIDISEKISKIEFLKTMSKMPVLRRNNRIHSVHSSLSIENNSLTSDQVFDVIDGKSVIGPLNEIQEVKNAYIAYDLVPSLNPFSEKDLLKAHGIMGNQILSDAGKYRNGEEGVFDGDKCIFMAPPSKLVPQLMSNLFDWLKNDVKTHMLIKSCVFHYEFVFIHPFSDCNGRMARLWQNALLSKWKEEFAYVPIETQIKQFQQEYYDAISNSHVAGHSNPFIEFSLSMINKTLDEILLKEKSFQSSYEQISALLDVMEKDIPLNASEIMARLGIKSKTTLRQTYLNPAIMAKVVFMTEPDSPTSKTQKYYKR